MLNGGLEKISVLSLKEIRKRVNPYPANVENMVSS
jgi:hypothetical protein